MSNVSSAASMKANMSAPERRYVVCARHGFWKYMMFMRRQDHRSWRGRQPRRLRSCKNPWMTASRFIRRKRLCLDQMRKRVVNQTNPLATNLTSQPWVTVLAVCNLKWSDHPSQMAHPGQRRGRRVTATIQGMKNDKVIATPAPETVALPDTCQIVTRPVAIAVIIPFHHQLWGRPNDRSREWSSACSAAASTASCHHAPTGQLGSSRQSHAKDSGCGSTAPPVSSPLSSHETSGRGDSSGHPKSARQARANDGRCSSMDSLASPSTSKQGASKTIDHSTMASAARIAQGLKV